MAALNMSDGICVAEDHSLGATAFELHINVRITKHSDAIA